MSPELASLLLALGGVGLVGAHFCSRRAFLFLAGFLLPLASIRADVGISVSFAALLGPAAILLLLLSRATISSVARFPCLRVFVIWCVSITVAWMIADYGVLRRYELAEELGFGAGQASLRMPVQLASFICQGLALFIIPMRARAEQDVRSGFSGYYLGCVVSAIIGVVMVVAGGIGLTSGTREAAIVQIGSSDQWRLGGLSSEPRHLGSFLVLLIAVLLPVKSPRNRRIGKGVVLAVALVSLFLTFSTSAWLGFIAVIGTCVALQPTERVWRLAPTVGIALLGLVILLLSPYVQSSIEARMGRRLLQGEGGIDTQKDYYVVQVYTDEPHHVVTGFGMGGFDFAAIPYIPVYSYWREIVLPTPTSNFMRFFGDLGFVGLVLLLLLILRWMRALHRDGRRDLASALAASFAGLMLVSNIALPAWCFLAGGMLAMGRLHSGTLQQGQQ